MKSKLILLFLVLGISESALLARARAQNNWQYTMPDYGSAHEVVEPTHEFKQFSDTIKYALAEHAEKIYILIAMQEQSHAIPEQMILEQAHAFKQNVLIDIQSALETNQMEALSKYFIQKKFEDVIRSHIYHDFRHLF